ncbi:MAG: SurA N-terminal domain-containing protein [Candidatus Hydrogenedentes bacterium]|nr:SurA N-terminal domain-containing protein [Candidatus Hydrogenedentota bacterium]
MIQDAMRKHKRLMLGILLVLIIGPFVLWGGSFGYGSDPSMVEGGGAVAVVGDTPISAELYRRDLQMQRQQMAQFGGQPPSPEQMLRDGTAMRVLDILVGRELLASQAKSGDYQFDREYLVEKIKEWPAFQDEAGNFDAKRWNEVVRQRQNWNVFYEQERLDTAYQLVVQRAAASARVLDEDIRKQFEEQNTSYELKYVAVAPKIEPSEEQIKETYDQNTEAYALPEKRKAEFVAFSLVPPMPQLANDLVTRARGGEDFGKLATENSTAPSKDKGGDLDWLTEGPVVSPHRKPLFALQKGQVSDPAYGPNGYYIYKVEDERTDPTTNAREVKAREILVSAVLSEEEYKAAQDKAKQLQEKAKSNGDLRAAALEAGLEVQTTGQFSIESLNIENLPDSDARQFRSRLATVALNEVAEPLEAQRNIYVAKVIELEAAVPQPLEAVREKVVQDTIARIGGSPEYRKQTEDLARSILESAKSLQDVVTQHPELNAIIETIPSFTTKTYDFQKGPMWNPRDVLETAKTKEPGAFFGPITDFMGKTYFVELVSKTPPDEKAWAEQWPKEEKALREQALMQEQRRRLDDYVAYLREDLVAKGHYQIDTAAFNRALGIEQETPAEAAPESTAPVDAAAPATEGAATDAAAAPAPAEPAPATAESTPAPSEPAAAPAETPAPAQ